jgi:outer membrane protein assembly complex protein YaeT
MSASRLFICAATFVALLATFRRASSEDFSPDADWFGKVIRTIEYAADGPLDRSHYDHCIGLKPGDTLTRTGLKAAIQALYDTGNFSDIAAEASTESDGVQLQFRLVLSTYFDRFIVPRSVDLAGRSPAEAMALPVGERFSAQKLEEASQAVLKYMRERGYYQADVSARTVRNALSRQVDTTFTVHTGQLATIRSLDVTGVPPEEAAAIQRQLKIKVAQEFARDRFRKRLDALKNDLVSRGYLEAELQIAESYEPGDNTVTLVLSIANFGQVRIAVVGFKLPKDQLRRLIPALSGEGLRPELLQEGLANLRDYMEDLGYPEAEIAIQESHDSAGARMIRYNIDRGRRVTVREVRFRGNRSFTDQELLKAIQLQPSGFFQKTAYSVSKLDADEQALAALYQSDGFLDATIVPLVEPLKNGSQLRLTFECAEGARALVRSVQLERDEGLPAEPILARMSLKNGSPYSPNLAEHDRQVILAAYNDAGFLQPTVTWRAAEAGQDHSYAVVFQIKEGARTRIDNIILLGRDRTRASVIEKRIALKKSQPLSLGQMLQTQQSLYNTGAFDLVRVGAQNPESTSPYQNVVVRVQEARPINVRYGFGYQQREKLRGTLQLSDPNIFGLGRRVDLSLRGSAIEQAAILSFQQPQIRFFPVDSFFTFSANKTREISFDLRRFDLSYQYSHPYGKHTWGLLRYSFTNVKVSQVTPDLLREETPRNLSAVSAYYINDTRDSYMDPEKGFFTSTDLSVTTKLPTSTFASGYYFSLFTQNSYYRRLTPFILMAASFRFGLIHGFAGDRTIPISERFFAGGGSSLRGFSVDAAGPLGLNNEPIGGNALLIGNLELRVPLVSRFQLAIFYDGGNVYPNVSALNYSDFSHTLGGGLRLKTPFGPIRLDYGINLNLSEELRSLGYKRGHFFVTIGPPF